MKANTMNTKLALKYYALSLLFTVLSVTQLWAYDFNAVSPSGHRLYYTITSNTAPRTVEVVSPTGNGYSGYTEPTGNVVVPETVTYAGNTYRVEGLAARAFYRCTQISTLSLPTSLKYIGDHACYDNYALTSITIPDSVTSIGACAFQYNRAMTSAVLPAQLQTIGNYAFYGNSNLSSISTIPTSVTSIGTEAFHNTAFYNNSSNWSGNALYKNNCLLAVKTTATGSLGIRTGTRIIANTALKLCDNITSVSIPNTMIYIGENAFEKCFSLTSITIPHSVSFVGKTAFKECTGLNTVIWNTPNADINHYNAEAKPFDQCSQLTNFIFGDSVRIIPVYALYNLASIQTLSISDNVETIRGSAFYGCSGLTSVDLSNVDTIEGHAFYGCSGLTSIDLSNVDTIVGFAFSNCSSLTSVDLGNIKTIGINVFSDCRSLTSIDLSNVETIGNSAFYNCSSLTSIDLSNVETIGNSAFSRCSSLTSVDLSNVETIGDWAFYNCSSLTSIDFPESVSAIGDEAFRYCDNLLFVEIPHYINHVGTRAFSSCNSLKTVVWNTQYSELNHDLYGNQPFEACDSLTTFIFGDSVRTIQYRALGGGQYRYAPINIRKMVIGKNVDTIGLSNHNDAFNVCSNLDTIISYAQTPPIILYSASSAWGNTPTGTLVLVPCGSANAYRSSLGWNRFTNIPDRLANGEITISVNNENYGSAEYDCPSQLLEAIPVYGYRFARWSDNNTDNPRLVEITQDTAFEAIFEVRLPYDFAITSGNTVRGNATGSGTYLQDTVVTISATPNYGYHFTQWSDGDTNNPRNIMVMSDTTLTAIFDKNTYNLSVNSANTALGTVVGGGSFEYLDTITIIATAMPGYEFYSWDDGDTNSVRRVVVTESKTYTATFGLPAFYLVVNANDTAMGRVTGRGFYVINSLQQITATANSGYHFVEWSDGNTNRTRSVRMVSDTSFTAIFAKNTYNIYITNNIRGVFTGAGRYEYLDTATISVVPKYGYSFVRWNDGDTNATRQVVVTGNRTYTATFSTNSYTINVVSNDTTMGTVSGAGTYAYNTNRTITATPTAFEYYLLYWSDGCTDNPRTIRVLSDTTYYAIFGHKPTYTLTVLSNNNAAGIVTGSDTALLGSNLEISATATVYGYHFARWSDGSTQNPRTIQMLKDSTITAIFERNTYTLATSVYGGTAYGSVAGGGYHLYLDTVSITATPNYGYHFTAWNDSVVDNPRTIQLMSDTLFTAIFDRNTYNLACSVNVGNRGNVSGAGNYLYSDNISITATANYGYHFAQWSDGNTQNPRTIRLERDTVFTAIFERNTYSVSGAVNVQDRGSISGVGNYLYLDSASITANANYGYHFTQWSDGNTDNPRIIQITKDSTLTAEFDKNTYTVSANANFEDRGTITGAGEYLYKELAQISAAPEYGYNFVRWNDGNTQRSRFLNVLSDTSFTAIFEPIVYRVTVGVDPGNTGRGTVVGGGNIAYKDSTTIKAFSLYGYHFTRWNDINTDSIRTVEVLGNASYYAYFAPNKYTVNLSVSDEAMGTIEGNGSYDYLTEVQIRANSKQRYFFSQWSDGNKDNPRTITLKRDTALTAHFTDTYVGVEEAEELANLAFYPNPTEGTITFNNRDIKKIEVMDAVGRVVAVHKNSYIIDLSKLSKGLYTLRITLPQGVTIRKVVRK